MGVDGDVIYIVFVGKCVERCDYVSMCGFGRFFGLLGSIS